MTDIVTLALMLSLPLNGILLIAYARAYNRHAIVDRENLHLLRHIKAFTADLRKLHDQQRSSIRRDPQTGRYLKNRDQ